MLKRLNSHYTQICCRYLEKYRGQSIGWFAQSEAWADSLHRALGFDAKLEPAANSSFDDEHPNDPDGCNLMMLRVTGAQGSASSSA